MILYIWVNSVRQLGGQWFVLLSFLLGGYVLWKELKDCGEGNLIEAWFLGNRNPEDSSDYNWHRIYKLEQKSNGKYYAAIEEWRGGEVNGTEDVFVKL